MLQVEGKTFHKFVEIKNYRTSLYLNYCDINQKDRNILGLYVETKQKDKFFSDAQFYTEDDFVKHFGNPLASVHFNRQRLFIEEGDDKISIKFQFYQKTRKVGGRYYECFYSENSQYLPNRLSVPLTPKEKDRIADLIPHLTDYRFSTLLDHLDMKRDLMNLGEDVKFKFTNISSFNLEHEEFSRLLQSYRKGEVERFYGDVDSLETPIEHEGETYYPVLLRKTTDYEKESQHQRNCVRGYSERPDCFIFSIRKGSIDGDERITVEYQYRKNEILNVQERAKFNETPSVEFSHVAKIQLANINLMYKLGTLKLPKMIKKYRSGKEIEQQATFDNEKNVNGSKIISMVPHWDTYTPELSYWQNEILGFDMPAYDNLFDELP